MSQKSTRRKFIGQTAALTAGVGYFASSSPKLFAADSPMQKLTAGCIGVGGKGGSDTSHIAEQGVEIVGLCDVDGSVLVKKGREFASAKQFNDFREMLDQLGDKVDIVTVSTPDHTHASAAVRAMRMKKHVYCQKPLTWSIAEARLMRETAEEMGVVTQMGNQGTSENGLREAVEVIRSGAIGDVSEIHIWSNRPVWPQGLGRPEGSDPVPENLNWDAWIGPAPMRPYKAGAYHSFNWRGWVDFGTGALGDMACHTTNLSVMALKLWDPVAMTAVRNPGIFEGETFPGSSEIKFEFPEREGLSACNFHWYDGGNLPPERIIAQLPKSFQKKVDALKKDPSKRQTSGAVLVGSKGLLFSPDDYGAQYMLLPNDQYTDFTPPEQTLPRIPYEAGNDQRQKWEFVSTVKGEYEPGTMANFGYAGRLTETILAGNLAMRAGQGQRIEWDAATMTSPNVPAVNQFVGREYRAGWELEGLPAVAKA
ncbi:Inositol 2-dehydrogenase [Rubripirellula lacrimiformis]|uniref:Inositol 2-dehydrogenase n=1 Tax=Rubripirellula lacrimiformis TaxID=1930273 RepID=A0A517NI95_9BACT|nr:Gfo/Idh/MocA family oxidoreductase [Rubripirellula lacrimiformis]QDT06857.1 Inositol 2-dehydrogenase [Rubripirellula lacrimiformis]